MVAEAGVALVGAPTVGASVGMSWGISIVGAAARGVNDPPLNRTMVPSTMLNATNTFNPVCMYQRQSRFAACGFLLLGIASSILFAIIPQSRAKTN